MDTLLPIVLLMFLICLIGNTNGIRCYNCATGCPDPFNKTNPNVYLLESPSGWCVKLKLSQKRGSDLMRYSAPFGFCTENKCKSAKHNGFKGAGCCCDTELCNNSNTITKSFSSFIGLALLTGMSVLLNY